MKLVIYMRILYVVVSDLKMRSSLAPGQYRVFKNETFANAAMKAYYLPGCTIPCPQR